MVRSGEVQYYGRALGSTHLGEVQQLGDVPEEQPRLRSERTNEPQGVAQPRAVSKQTPVGVPYRRLLQPMPAPSASGRAKWERGKVGMG